MDYVGQQQTGILQAELLNFLALVEIKFPVTIAAASTNLSKSVFLTILSKVLHFFEEIAFYS